MDKNGIIDKTVQYVKKKLYNEPSGHDWLHIYRVWKMSILFAKEENANQFIVQMSALLHDIGDYKFFEGDMQKGHDLVRDWLEKMKVDRESKRLIMEIIKDIDFKGALVESRIPSLEGKIVQDADRLDAIGAIGIARTFAYGGHKNRVIYDPNIKPVLHDSFQSYRDNKSPSINHFYEKLLLVKDRLHTATAKKFAQKRHSFMELFLEKFYEEISGES